MEGVTLEMALFAAVVNSAVFIGNLWIPPAKRLWATVIRLVVILFSLVSVSLWTPWPLVESALWMLAFYFCFWCVELWQGVNRLYHS